MILNLTPVDSITNTTILQASFETQNGNVNSGQTIIQIHYHFANGAIYLGTLDAYETRLIENARNVWLHPFRELGLLPNVITQPLPFY